MTFRQRTRRTRRTQPSRIEKAEAFLLRDRRPPEDDPDINKFVVHGFTIEGALVAWPRHREDVLKDWPDGSRPLAWWLFDLPPEERPFEIPAHVTHWAMCWQYIPSPSMQRTFLKKHGL